MNPTFTAEINLPRSPSQSSFRAFAKLIIDGVVVIDGWRVMDSKFGLFAAPPSEKSNKTDENGRNIWYDKVRFIEDVPDGKRKGPFAEAAEKAIIDAYNAKTQSTGGGNSRPNPTGDRPSAPASAPPMW